MMSGKTDCCEIRSPAHYINEEDGFTYLERCDVLKLESARCLYTAALVQALVPYL